MSKRISSEVVVCSDFIGKWGGEGECELMTGQEFNVDKSCLNSDQMDFGDFHPAIKGVCETTGRLYSVGFDRSEEVEERLEKCRCPWITYKAGARRTSNICY